MEKISKYKRSLVETGDEISKEFGSSFRLPKKGSEIAESDFKNMQAFPLRKDSQKTFMERVEEERKRNS